MLASASLVRKVHEVDAESLGERLPRARLLFVAHREEILAQSLATFQQCLRDSAFGELWVGGRRPRAFGPASYVRHESELPMAITWRLHHPLPGDLYAKLRAAS